METIPDILASPVLRQKLFPVTRHKKYFAHAGVAPLSGPAAEASRLEAEAGSCDSQERADFWPRLQHIRTSCADLLKVTPDEISLLGPTALGLNLVALGLDWERGDEVVFSPGCYPANVYPWLNLQKQGVNLVPLSLPGPGEITPDRVFAALTPRTKLVALASCHFLSGYRLDYRTIGEELRRRGILFCVDAIQSLGATTLDATFCDFLAADAHKWMLGPNGAGIFYVRAEAAERLKPALLGSWNVASPNFIAQSRIDPEKGGRRYEPGSLNNLGNEGMAASLMLLNGLGIPQIEERILHLRDILVDGLLRKGWTVLSAHHPQEARSGIISCWKPGVDLISLGRQLRSQDFAISLRNLPEGTPFLRFSPHFYNLEAEIEALLEALP